MSGVDYQVLIPVRDYDLAATLSSGQSFRWRARGGHWEGVVAGCWVRLAPIPEGVLAWTARPCADWNWLTGYLQAEADLGAIVSTFPDDAPMRESLAACRGLRLLRQDPWECLVSFICSSTKQIIQIQQIIELLCQRYGEALPILPGAEPAWGFPTPAQLAAADEA